MIAAIAQLVERIHGKDEVTGSNPVRGSTSFTLKAAISAFFLVRSSIRRASQEEKTDLPAFKSEISISML